MNIVCLALLALLIPFAQPVMADDAAHRKLAEEFLSLLKIEQMVEQSFDRIQQMQTAQMRVLDQSGERSANFQKVQKKIMDFLTEELTWEKIKDDYINIYSEVFTEVELRGLIRFHKTPLGQTYIEKTPELMNKSIQISQKHMATLMPKIRELSQEMMKQPMEGQGNKPMK